MSEIVQRKMEAMTEEFEDMVRTQLFTSEEIRIIANKRKKFEYNICSTEKKLENYKEYITYETNLINMIKLRRGKFKIDDKKGCLENRILQRIKNIYEVAVPRFPDNIQFGLSFFQFCKQVRFTSTAKHALDTLVRNHPNRPPLWQICAKYYSSELLDIDGALQVFDKARAFHKSFEYFYLEPIKLEISKVYDHKTATKLEDTDEAREIRENCIKRLKIYLEEMYVNIKSYKFYIELITYLEPYKFTMDIQRDIIEHTMKTFYDVPALWHLLAQREKNGLHYDKQDNDKKSSKARLTLCFKKYNEGLSVIPQEKKGEMWKLYLDYLIDLTLEEFGVAKEYKTKTLLKAFADADLDGVLIERHYVHWVKMLNKSEAGNVLKRGTTALPESIELWKLRMQHYVIAINENPQNYELEKEFEYIFRQALNLIKEKSLPLWTLMIRYKSLCKSFEEINALYKEGVSSIQSPEISSYLKPQYVEWLAMTKGITAARDVYDGMANEQPYCKMLHVLMGKLEEAELNFNFERWEKVLRTACEQFGNEDDDVWINYIDFHMNYKKENIQENVTNLCNKAKVSLPPAVHIDFMEKYQKLCARSA